MMGALPSSSAENCNVARGPALPPKAEIFYFQKIEDIGHTVQFTDYQPINYSRVTEK